MSGETVSDKRFVREAPIFRDLAPGIVDEIMSDCQWEEHPAGACLFRQGEPANAFFIMLGGWVKLVRITAAGDEVVIGLFTRGQSFAETVGLAGKPYPAHCEAVTAMCVVRVPSERLRQRILDHPEIGLSLIALTTQNLHQLVVEITRLKAHTSTQRVAAFLLSLIDGKHGACTISLPIKKALIAGRLGMKEETLSRAFARLRAAGVVVNGRSVRISDVALLRACMLEKVP